MKGARFGCAILGKNFSVSSSRGEETVRNALTQDAIVFAGGDGTAWDFSKSPVVSAIYKSRGYVTAECHGAAALLQAIRKDGKPIIARKKVAGFSDEEENAVGLVGVARYLVQDELAALGANHQEGKAMESFVVQNGRNITGQNPQSAT